MSLGRVLLSIIFPPLAVLDKGCGSILIVFILTIVGWVPGKRFLNLLLLADEQESMIDRYLERGEMFVLYKKEIPVAACVITDEGDNVCEIKNIAVLPQYQRQGYGRRLIDFLFERYKKSYRVMLVGTGDTFSTISFYEHCGFVRSHRLPGFFTDHYDHPIFEEGKQLVDMVYLKKEL